MFILLLHFFSSLTFAIDPVQQYLDLVKNHSSQLMSAIEKIESYKVSENYAVRIYLRGRAEPIEIFDSNPRFGWDAERNEFLIYRSQVQAELDPGPIRVPAPPTKTPKENIPEQNRPNLGLGANSICLDRNCRNISPEMHTNFYLSPFLFTNNPFVNSALYAQRFVPPSPEVIRFSQDLAKASFIAKSLARNDADLSRASYEHFVDVLKPFIGQTVNPNLTQPAKQYPKLVSPESIDQELRGLREASAQGSPIRAVAAINQLKQEITNLRMVHSPSALAEADYLESELHRNLLNTQGILKGLVYAKSPDFVLSTSNTDQEGLRIRNSLNHLLAAEETIGFSCEGASDSGDGVQAFCSSLDAQTQELKLYHKIADRMFAQDEKLSYEPLMDALEKTTKNISEFVSGFLDGSKEGIVATAQGVSALILHPREVVEGLYKAFVHYDQTWTKIENAASQYYEDILSGDPKKIGEISGKLTVDVLTCFVSPSLATRALEVGSATVLAVEKGLLKGSLEKVALLAEGQGVLSQSASTGLREIAQTVPELGREIFLQGESSVGTALQKVGGIENFLSAVVKEPQLTQDLERLGKLRTGAPILEDEGVLLADLKAPILNPLPENGRFARVMPRVDAEIAKNGNGVLSNSQNALNEAFITAAEDIEGINSKSKLAERLGLYKDSSGVKLKDLNDFVIFEFDIKDLKNVNLRPPLEYLGKPRGYGFIPGGKTSGGAREWIVDADISKKDLLENIVIREMKGN